MRTMGWTWVLAACVCVTGCAGTIAPPNTTAAGTSAEALLVLPGFGYSRDGERAIRALAPAMREEGLDLYVPTYIARGGLDDSRERLRRFLRDERLDRYRRVHVFAFLAGGWTFNALTADRELLPNLGTVIYDRSPFQERAPRIAAERLTVLAWLRYGSVLFDIAKTPYAPLPRREVKVGLLVETTPTSFVKKHQHTAQSYGPFAFECAAFSQPHDDCVFVALNHTELYERFGEVWPEIRTFIRSGHFSEGAVRQPPARHALEPGGTQ